MNPLRVPPPGYRTLQPGQRCEVWIGGPDLVEPLPVLTATDLLIEAPNWAGNTLYLNGNGTLWRIDLADPLPGLRQVQHDELPVINNDHVLSPTSAEIYMSAMDGQIYRGPLTGGAVEQITDDDHRWHFLHGVSPDGSRLAYVELTDFSDPGQLAVLALNGERQLIPTGPGHLDGPEWSPDGAWIYCNTESFTTDPGHAQLARIPDGGGPMQRLVTSDTVDWFPHLAPDGRHASYLAFPPGTLGHPADLDVQVRVVSTQDWSRPVQTYPLFGGQGTLNVNSWSPDGTRFAFVSYPID